MCLYESTTTSTLDVLRLAISFVFIQIEFFSFVFVFVLIFFVFVLFHLLKNKARGYTIKKRILSTNFFVWFLIVSVQISAIRFAIRFAKMRFVVLNIFIYNT